MASRAPTRAEGRGAPGDTPKTRPGCGARPRGSRGRREGRTAAPSPRGAGDARLWTFRCRGLGANLVCFRPVRGSWPSVRPQRPAGDRGDAREGARGRSGWRARSPNPEPRRPASFLALSRMLTLKFIDAAERERTVGPANRGLGFDGLALPDPTPGGLGASPVGGTPRSARCKSLTRRSHCFPAASLGN